MVIAWVHYVVRDDSGKAYSNRYRIPPEGCVTVNLTGCVTVNPTGYVTIILRDVL